MNAPMLTANEVMPLFGYKSKRGFWEMVKREGVPHVRFNARVIKFEAGPLDDWLEKRRSVKSTPKPFLPHQVAALSAQKIINLSI